MAPLCLQLLIYIKMSTDNDSVFAVFNDINKVQTASKAQVFELVRLFRLDPNGFQQAFQLAYLKIFKIFHERANRKMPPKFQQLPASLFHELLSKDKEDAVVLLNFFLQFLAEAIFSSILGIRITAARMLFHLIKQTAEEINTETRAAVLKAIFYLLRLKVSTYKQLGIKLAALVMGWEHQLRDKIEEELFKILATEDNEQIRKMAITNLPLARRNLDRVIIRLRDKSAEVRSIVLRKLTGQRYKIQEMGVNHRIHLLYDGYGNKETSIQQQTLRYFSRFLPNHQAFPEFVEQFGPNTLLIHPHLYALFDSLVEDIVEELPLEQLCNFTRAITNELKQICKNGMVRNSMRELIWLKNIGRSENAQLKAIFEECIPSGLEFSRILLEMVKGRDIFTIHECLQLIGLQKSADELGRNRMFDSLKRVVMQLQYFQLQDAGIEGDDLSPPLDAAQLHQKRMMLSYYDLPLISCSYDLLFEIGTAMRALWPDHYEIEMKQIMAEWNNPQENSLLKEKELAQANIAKLEAQGDKRLLDSLRLKLRDIEEQLEIEGIKTRSIILILNRLRPTLSMDDFMPVIKQDLAKSDQSQGLILLGLYCLQELKRVETFLPLYWIHLSGQERVKLHLMVALKATTDFMVKFDLTAIAYDGDGFTCEKYLRKMQDLVLDSDGDIRILAIEGLCRIIYHNRVPEQLLGSCFMRLLLLWWETSSEQVSAKAVHTISLFVRQYIQRGPAEVRKLSESLCVFFKVLLLKQAQHKTINKRRVTYNLKIQEFVRRAVVIAMTVLKYHKQSRQIIWKYQQSGAQLGPQELFILFLFRHEELHYCIDRALNISDFYEEAPLETLILMKKEVQNMLEGTIFINRKNLESMLKKLEQDLEERIEVKNQETFNEQLLEGLKKELKEYQALITSTAVKLGEELEEAEIFTTSPDAHEVKAEVQKPEESEDDEDVDVVIAEIEEAIHISSQSQQKKKKGKQSNNLSRISELQQSQEKEQTSHKKDQERKSQAQRKGRKRQPQLNEQQEEQLNKPTTGNPITLRTRSRHRV